MTVNDTDAAIRAALDGLGIAYTLDVLVESFLRSGQFVRVLADWSPNMDGVYLYCSFQPHFARSSTSSDRPQGARIAGASRTRFNLLAHSSFGGTPYSLDKAGIVECLTKSRRSVCPLIQVADELRVDLPHIDCRLHDIVGDSWRVGFCECSA